MNLPPCGLYRTSEPIGSIPAGKLVYFHNHGEPGPGLYLPASWKGNRMQLSKQGNLLPSPEDVRFLEPLPPEGFYRVVREFHCCDKKCRLFQPETLLQLGYNGDGAAIAFVPEFIDGMLALPTQGSRIDSSTFEHLKQLRVPVLDKQTEH